MFDCYLIWGDPRDFSGRRVYRKALHHSEVSISADGYMLALDVGPVPLAGPIVHSEPAGADPRSATSLSVFIDTDVPPWIEEGFITTLAWEAVDNLPRPSRYPFQVDVLMLASNWAGAFDGWSSTQWFDSSVKPLQRIPLALAPEVAGGNITVHVLDVGQDVHGVGYAVVFAPDREVLDGFEITRNGWRNEPIARLRRQAWAELADLSTQMLVTAVPVLGSAVVADVDILVDPQFINQDALNHLPDDVYQVVVERLTTDYGWPGGPPQS